jgi:hypothetical protein
VLGVVLSQQLQHVAAVVPQTTTIKKSSFCIKSYLHTYFCVLIYSLSVFYLEQQGTGYLSKEVGMTSNLKLEIFCESAKNIIDTNRFYWRRDFGNSSH